MTEKNEVFNILALVSEVVAAYVSNNEIPYLEVPILIQQVYRSLCMVDGAQGYLSHNRKEPIIPIQDSVQPDYIVCLEDGRQLKMLKRHLKTAYNMTPDQYRERWGLSPDYPMVAPNYAKRRSKLAKNIGLGRGKGRHRQRAIAA